MHYLGIDIGSTTIKAVITDSYYNIIFTDYQRHNANIRHTLKIILTKVYRAHGNIPLKVVLTGSVAMGYAERSGLKFVQEVVASAAYIQEQHPEVHTLVDMGGEDSKMIFFNEGKVPDMRMNGVCAGGTGAFIDQMASLLYVSNADINTLAKQGKQIYPIASRCGVFAKTDIQNLIANGVAKSDVVLSTFKSLAVQAVGALARGVDITPPILFSGGPFAFMPELKRHFCEVIGIGLSDIVEIEHPELVPALGCTLMAKDEQSVDLLSMMWYIMFGKHRFNPSDEKQGLQQLFSDTQQYDKWQSEQCCYNIPTTTIDLTQEYYLGIDSGSTTTKIVLLDSYGAIAYSSYRRNEGDSFSAFFAAMKDMHSVCGDVRIANSTITGYGESLLKTAFSLNNGIVETIAHTLSARKVIDDVSFVLDIGGQDMKAIFVKDGHIHRIEINESCSSGCGSFLETFANSFGYPIAKFADMACFARQPYDLGTRCTVFMNSKVKQAMREGASVEDIAAGFSYSVIKNCLYKVLRLKSLDELGSAIVVQGGTFKNKSVIRALELLTGCQVRYTDHPELMGAYGAALYSIEHAGEERSLSEILLMQNYTASSEHCVGCENSCMVKVFSFTNGKKYFSGNKCEKFYSNNVAQLHIGENLLAEKRTLLFSPTSSIYNTYTPFRNIRIGIPRALGMYENYPFWRTLFESLGFKVQLSGLSTNRMLERGAQTIMSESVCFPAKLMHGHIIDLIDKGVDRIFYPYVVYERKDDTESANSYNCPIVAGYSDVIRSAINPAEKYSVPFDSPIVSLNDEKLTLLACTQYFASFGISKREVACALEEAKAVQFRYYDTIQRRSNEILDNAIANNRMVIVLAGRPYHSDPLIEHKLSEVISRMGVDIVTENIATKGGADVFSSLNAVAQWSYTNRIFKAAHIVAGLPQNVQFVEFNSFGCGPDAFILDEVNTILSKGGKFSTTLKIDDVNNIGSLFLRIRSLVESHRSIKSQTNIKCQTCNITTPPFEKEDERRTLLAPHFADGYSEFIAPIFSLAGYRLEVLLPPSKEDEEEGLRYAHNDVCYPATLVIGSLMRALRSGKYDLNDVAVITTQTGGQCRASNYLSLLKSAMQSAGISNVPVVSLALGSGMNNSQPGFNFPWLKLIPTIFRSMIFADSLLKLFYVSVPRSGGRKEECVGVKQRYTERAIELIRRGKSKQLDAVLVEAMKEFKTLATSTSSVPRVGIVGEIFVKYNSYSHKNIIQWLVDEGVEVIPTSLYNFFSTALVNNVVNKEYHIERVSLPQWANTIIYKMLRREINRFEKKLSDFPYFENYSNVFHDMDKARRIVSPAANFGEGWLIPAEVSNMAERGINNVISIQPFACIANHVISKGVEKRIKQLYPHINMLFLDFDASTSDANIYNRLHFMLNNAKNSL